MGKKLKILILSALLCGSFSSCSQEFETGLMPGGWSGYINDENISIESAYIVDGEEISVSEEEYKSVRENQAVFLVVNGGHLTIKDSKIIQSNADSEAILNASGEGDKPLDKKFFEKKKDDFESEENAQPNDDKTKDINEIKPNDEEKTQENREDAQEKNNMATIAIKPNEETKPAEEKNAEEKSGVSAEELTGSATESAANGGDGGTSDDKVAAEKNEPLEEYKDYGENSAVICIGEDSMVTIDHCTIETHADYANAVFVASGGIVDIKESTIITSRDYSKGISAAYGGNVNADKVKITTSGIESACVSVGEGGGTVTVSNGTFNTTGMASPLIFSAGNIIATDSIGEADISESVVMDGGTVSLEKCNFSSAAETSGILIYRSATSDSGEPIQFTLNSCDMKHSGKGSMFFVTNTKAEITSSSTRYTNGEIFMNASANKWGEKYRNGGDVTFNSSDEKIMGNIIADSVSKVNINCDKTVVTGKNKGRVNLKEQTVETEKMQ